MMRSKVTLEREHAISWEQEETPVSLPAITDLMDAVVEVSRRLVTKSG
jgi:hypothetical protein